MAIRLRKIVFVRDITARRQAENEVRETKEYLENILENSADPIGIVDQRGRIIHWNKAAEQVFGYSLLSLKVTHPLNFMPTAINFKPC